MEDREKPLLGSSEKKERASRLRKGLALLLAPLGVLFMGGLPFGFDAIFPVLFQSNLFLDACPQQQVQVCRNFTLEQTRNKCCDEQEEMMIAMSSTSLFAADASIVFYGELLDRFGPPATLAVGVAFQCLGLSTLALNAYANLTNILWYIAFLFLGVSGPGIFLAVLVFAELYTDVEEIITTLVPAAFDSSSIIFTLWKIVFFRGVSLQSIAVFSLALHAFVSACVYCIIPSSKELRHHRVTSERESAPKMLGESQFSDTVQVSRALLISSAQDSSTTSETCPATPAHSSLAVPNIPKKASSHTVVSLLLRRDTLLLLLFMCIANLKQSFYIQTAEDELPLLMNASFADSLRGTFDTVFPLFSFCSAPIVMLLLRRARGNPHIYFGVVCTCVCLSIFVQLLPFEGAQYAYAYTFGPARTAQWACYFHYFENPKHYPPSALGRLLGYASLVIAVFGDAPPYLFNLFIRDAKFPPRTLDRYLAIHISLSVGILLSAAALVFHLYKHKLTTVN